MDVFTSGASNFQRAALVVAVLVAAVAALIAVPEAGADDVGELRRELEGVRSERATIQRRLDAAAETLGDLEARIGELSDEEDALTAQLDELGVQLADAEDRAATRVRSLYKHGHVDPMMVLLSVEDPDEVFGRAAIVVSLVREDRAVQQQVTARRTEAEAVSVRLEENRRQLEVVFTEQRAVLASLEQDLSRAQTLERQLETRHGAAVRRQEEERRRQAQQREAQRQAAERQAATPRATSSAPAPSGGSGGYACPMAKPHSFSDTWGAPRSGGRRHQGTDMLGPRGAHLYAVTSGTVSIHGYGSSAGYWLTLRGDDGTSYRYMHLQGYAVGSQRVSRGQLIGYNGDTGNARGTPHLHFEQHPGGRGPINPYPFLRSIC